MHHPHNDFIALAHKVDFRMKKEFLKNAWYVAAWSKEITQQLFERTIIGESILFFRRRDGVAVALDNACPHRYSPLDRGTLNDDIVECAYHGLRFDHTGQCVYNPHGDGKIPKKARTRNYPLVERHDMLWIWMGAAELADANQIPDFSCHTDPNFPTVSGMIEMHGNYELITDNLMDLTHVEFVHAGILGSDAIKRGEHEVVQSGTTVYSNRWCPDGLAPPAWDAMFGNYGKPVDHWLYMRWDAPCHMLLDVGITPTGKARESGIWMYGTDILTPRNDTSTYYWWGVSRSYGHGDNNIDDQWCSAIDAAFGHQDKPMIEAQQRLLESKGVIDLDELDPVLLVSDSGPTRCRRIMNKLRENDGTELPDPRNPALTELREQTKGDYQGRIVPVV